MKLPRGLRLNLTHLGIAGGVIAFALLFGVLTRAVGLNTEPRLPPQHDRHAVIAITCPHAPYFALEDESGTEWQLIASALGLAGEEAQYLYVPYEEAMRYLGAGYVAGVWVCGAAVVRVNGYFASTPLLKRTCIVATLASSERHIDSLSGLAGLVVGLHPDIEQVLEPQAADILSTVGQLRKVSNHVLLATMLLTGQVDAVISEQSVFRESLRHVPKEADPTQQIDVHAVFPPVYPKILFRDPDLRDRFDAAWLKLAQGRSDQE